MKLSEARLILEGASVPDALHDARVIFSELGGYSLGALMASDPDCSAEAVISAVHRRAEREPLQYILGYVWFYRERYEVNENCLIPRSDTEALVEYACANIPDGENFIDLCTGSGCVGISTLKNTKGTFATLADISAGALDVAARNAQQNGVSERAELLLCDLLNYEPSGEYFAVLSNPPYVAESVYRGLEREIFFEPKIAFTAGEDGGVFYRSFTERYKKKLKPGGFIAYEIGYDQAAIISDIARECDMSLEIIKDLGGNDRVAVMKNKIDV